MKKIIEGKVYDTNTAKELGSWDNSYGRNDFSFVKETLYLKKTGEFFLYGEGGASSKYAVSAGQNCWRGGESIQPLSYENARKWAEEKLEADEYEAIFGEVVEDESKEAVCLSLSKTAIELAKRKAAESGKTFSDYIDALIKNA